MTRNAADQNNKSYRTFTDVWNKDASLSFDFDFVLHKKLLKLHSGGGNDVYFKKIMPKTKINYILFENNHDLRNYSWLVPFQDCEHLITDVWAPKICYIQRKTKVSQHSNKL